MENAQLAARRLSSYKKILEQEEMVQNEAKEAAGRQLAEEKQLAAARLDTAETAMSAAAKRKLEDEDAMSKLRNRRL